MRTAIATVKTALFVIALIATVAMLVIATFGMVNSLTELLTSDSKIETLSEIQQRVDNTIREIDAENNRIQQITSRRIY